MSEDIEKRIFKRFENKMTYSKKIYKTKTNFLNFCDEKNPFIKRYETLFKENFTKMENMIEDTLFIEDQKSNLLEQIQNEIINKEDLNIIKNEENIRSILKKVKIFLNNTLKTIKNNKKSILSIELTHQFYTTMEEIKIDVIKNLKENEENYKNLEDLKNFEKIFHEIEIFMDKVSKSLYKVQKTPLIFTIEEDFLETNKEKLEKNLINKDEIILRGKKCTKSLRKYCKTLKLLIECKFEDLEYRHIKTFLTNFHKEFSSEKNKFEEIFLFHYTYRDLVTNNMLVESGKFFSLIFQKISVFRTILFIDFAKENLFPEIEANLKNVKENVDEGLLGIEMIKLTALQLVLEKTKHYINFIISFLSSKKTYLEFFNNEILNESIPSILENLCLFKKEGNFLEREIGFFKDIFVEVNNYNSFSGELKLEKFEDFSNERNLKFSEVYMKFMKSHFILLKMVKTHYNGSALKSELLTMLEEDEKNMYAVFEKLYYKER